MDEILTAVMPEAIMPSFSYLDIIMTKTDMLELFIYCCICMMLWKMIEMYVQMPDRLATELEEADKNERKRKEVILKFQEYKLSIRNFFNGVFCMICSTYYVFAYGLRVDTWCNEFEHFVSTVQVAYFLSGFI